MAGKMKINDDPAAKGIYFHEIDPVKFGGSHTDKANKIMLTPAQHTEYTSWWNAEMWELKKQM